MTTVGEWLEIAGNYPLLSQSEELMLARTVQGWLAHPPPPPKALERRGQRARRRMIEGNLRLVHAVWKRYGVHLGVEPVDLLQVGVIGLARAVERFDPTRGYRFSTSAFWWIRQAITKEGNNAGGLIRLTSDCKAISKKLIGGVEMPEHLADRARMAIAARRMSSLDVCLESGTTLGEMVEDDTSGDQLLVMDAADRAAQLHTAIDQLPEEQRQVLYWAWGLTGGDPLTMHQIAKNTATPVRRVREICAAAEVHLKELLC